MNSIKKSVVIIGLGVINLLHAGLHILQFIQSMLLVKAASFGPKVVHSKGILNDMLHSPYFAILWAIVGIFTLVIGVRDFIHHRKCKHENILS